MTETDTGAADALRALCLRATASSFISLPLPRMLVILAHADDEVLALGGRLERMRASRILTVTDGAPRSGTDARHHGFASLDEYRFARRQELLAALADAGLTEDVVPAFSAQVPDQAASFHLAALTLALAEQLASFQPEVILTHPYEGGHPDHDACAFAVHAAVRLHKQHVPILEAPFYHADQNGSMCTGVFLSTTTSPWSTTYELTSAEQERKAARLACFRSQAETLAQFPVEEESFRLAPAYDFTKRPSEGKLFYEQFPWGMTGDRFCALATEAQEQLQLRGAAEVCRPKTALPAAIAEQQ